MRSVLFVANVAGDHILRFHVPTIEVFKKNGWRVDVACAGEEVIPHCDFQLHASWKRSPFTLKTFQGIRELKKLLNHRHYDLVVCHTPVGGLVARLAAKKARKNGTKVIYCAHGLHFFKGAPLINWMVYYPIEKYLARKTDAIFTVNREDYTVVTERFRKALTVKLVPEVGINTTRLHVKDKAAVREQYRRELGIPMDANVLIYVAELNNNKNQTMLIDTLETLRKKLPNSHLLLVGHENDGGAARRYSAQKGLAEAVHCLGFRHDIGELMQTADVCTASSIREGFGINLLEALYCGVPVIASDNRGHRMIIQHGENGFLVPLGDHEQMAGYVKQLLTDPTLYARFADVDVTRYDCRRVAEELYDEIVNCL